MNTKKNLILLVAVLLLSIVFWGLTGSLPSVSQAGDVPAAPGPFPNFGPPGICADSQYLYAVAGGKIIQYKLADLSQVKAVDLPEPVPPPSVSGTGMDAPPPPHFARSQWLLVTGGYLYVMVGPMVYQYSTSGLVLQTSVELPRPEFP